MNTSLTCIHDMAKGYGLYGDLISCRENAGRSSESKFIVLSQHPISSYLDPVELCNRADRDPDLFYPGEFAYRLEEGNILLALDESLEFMINAEFLATLYAEFHTPLPEKIRYSELAGLKNWVQLRSNPNAPAYLVDQAEKGLRAFFKKENSSLGQRKRSFFRSERFDQNASFLQRQTDYRQRKSSIVRLPVLLQSAENLGKTVISSAHLAKFNEEMEKSYPEVIYALSNKTVIDSGLIDYAKAFSIQDDFLDSVPVTDEEFQRMLAEGFDREGLSCVDGVSPAYWEYYDLYYKKADEAKIASVYNQITQGFIHSASLSALTAQGEVQMVSIPTNNLHLFVDLAKKAGVSFHIDFRGNLATPSFSEVQVAFNRQDRRFISKIIDEMVLRTWQNGHILLDSEGSKGLNQLISSVQLDNDQLAEPTTHEDYDYEK